MSDDFKKQVPVPVPRKPRVGMQPGYSSPRLGDTGHGSRQGDTGHGSRQGDTGHGSRQGDTGHGSIRYTAPVTPPISAQYSNSSNNTYQQHSSPSFIHQSSTPLPSYQPPVTPTNSYLRISSQPKKEYSGPQKVITPQPMSDGNESYGFSFTSRKDSRSSSRSSLSSGEPPSPLRLLSDELSFEIDRKKEIKVSLIDEVAQLTKQRDVLLADIEEHKLELNEFKINRGSFEESLNSLSTKENNIKRRIAQCEQNLQLMDRLKNIPPPTIDSDKEQIVKKRSNALDEKEYSLTERESRIRQKEIELQSEGDILFQRRKELDLREYDVKNFNGPQPPIGQRGGEIRSDIVEHEERERDLQQKERHLFEKESYLTDLEVDLKRKQDRISKWESEVKLEDNRAQENLKRAKEMMQEMNKIKDDALNATKVAAILEEQRHETHKPPISESSTGGNVPSTTHGASGGNYGVTGGNYGVTGGNYGDTGGNYGDTGGNYGYSSSSGTQPGVSASENIESTADDEMIARLMSMRMNAEMAQKDAEIAKQMSKVHETSSNDECDLFLESDAELAFQQQLEFMGIPPGSVDADALKKQLLEQLNRQRELEQTTSRDQELAASMVETDD